MPIAVLAVFAVVGVVVALTAIGGFASAAHASASGGSVGGAVGVGVICLVMLGGLIYMAVHVEHQLRHVSAPPDSPVVAPPPFWSVRSRRHGPASQAWSAVLMLAVAVFSLFAAVGAHSDADRSHRTQSGGRSTTAIVDVVRLVPHHGRYSTWYSSLLFVTEPDGAVTVVHDPQRTRIQPGERVQIVVDPSDPNYAELPNEPAATTLGWVMFLLLGVALALGDVHAWRVFIGMRRRRSWFSLPSAPAAPEPT